MALTEVNSLGIKDLEVKTADIAADAVNGDKIADDAINSEHYVDASIDHQHLANDAVDGDNIADDSVGAEHIADNAVGLAAMAHGTDGQIITYDASGAPVAVGPGTDGQVLTSTGAGSPPAFEAIPASGSATNLMMNGAMNVAQKATSSTSGGFEVMDRWQLNDNNTNTTITQSQHALTSGDTGPWALGFRNSYSAALSSAGNSLSAASYCQLKYMIEAQDIACSGWDYTSASSYITFSFWFKCSTNQTFHARWESYDGTAQNYPFSFTATGNNTWTKITKTIPGNTNITVNNDHGAGLGLSISLYSGTDRTGTVTLNQWGAFSGSTRHPNDADTWITAGASTWEITGVQLEVGNSASDFAFKSYAEDLRDCQRYYWKTLANNNEFFPGMGMADTDGNTVILNTQFPVRMRTAPSALEQTGTASDYKIRRSTTATCSSVPAFGHATVDQAVTNFISSSHGFGDGSAVRCMSGGTDHYLAWSAEL